MKNIGLSIVSAFVFAGAHPLTAEQEKVSQATGKDIVIMTEKDPAITPKVTVASLKYGLYTHFGMPTFVKPGEKELLPAARFAPTDLDIPSLARVAKENGMDFAIFIAKDDTGFCFWDSVDYDYDVANSPVKKNLVAEFLTACKKQGVVPGVHYSIPDQFNEGAVQYGVEVPVGQSYFAVIKRQLAELQTQHPDLRLITLAGVGRLSVAQTAELYQQFKRLNPSGFLLGLDGYKGGLDGQTGELTTSRNWVWTPNAKLFNASEIYQNYSRIKTSGRPCVINVGLDPAGRLPMEILAIVKEFTALKNGGEVSPGTDSKPDVATRLKQLKALLDQGIITQDEYDTKKKELINAL